MSDDTVKDTSEAAQVLEGLQLNESSFEAGDDVIDSRDIIERIEELEDMEGNDDLDKEEEKELKELRALAEEAEGYADWEHGETLILDSYFEEYAQELAEDTGMFDSNANWPMNHIDWEAAADELKFDYSIVEFGNYEYWIRN